MAKASSRKAAVTAVCRALQAYGIHHVVPETLRQAKHNVAEAVRGTNLIQTGVERC